MRCTKSYVLNRRASFPAMPTLTSIRPIAFLQNHTNNTRASRVDTAIPLTATSYSALSSIQLYKLGQKNCLEGQEMASYFFVGRAEIICLSI